MACFTIGVVSCCLDGAQAGSGACQVCIAEMPAYTILLLGSILSEVSCEQFRSCRALLMLAAALKQPV